MQDLPVLLAIAGLTVMGVGAIAKPAFVPAQFGILELTPAGRSDLSFVILPRFLVVLVLLTNRSQQETSP
jgi:hypothetical protein